MVALAWKWFVRLTCRGRNPCHFISAIATFAARAVRSGRRLCGQERSKDLLSPVAQQKHGFAVGKPPDFSTLSDNPLSEALQDNTQTPPDEQAAFRLDFPAFLATLSEQHRQLLGCLMLGERTVDVARRFRRSPARISQLRREFHDAWLRFHGEMARASRSR